HEKRLAGKSAARGLFTWSGNGGQSRGAGFQPAVSQGFQPEGAAKSEGRGEVERSADWKSAIQQVGNLRYVVLGRLRPWSASGKGAHDGGVLLQSNSEKLNRGLRRWQERGDLNGPFAHCGVEGVGRAGRALGGDFEGNRRPSAQVGGAL